MRVPVNIVYAGIGATRPPDMIDAAEEAVVWLILLSNVVHCGAWVSAAIDRHNPKPISSAIIDMLNDQPIFSPE
jgi:hypothetical protein